MQGANDLIHSGQGGSVRLLLWIDLEATWQVSHAASVHATAMAAPQASGIIKCMKINALFRFRTVF